MKFASSANTLVPLYISLSPSLYRAATYLALSLSAYCNTRLADSAGCSPRIQFSRVREFGYFREFYRRKLPRGNYYRVITDYISNSFSGLGRRAGSAVVRRVNSLSYYLFLSLFLSLVIEFFIGKVDFSRYSLYLNRSYILNRICYTKFIKKIIMV